jgi:dTDP-4-amino-4,6-dideoxygalactose transaminase
MEAVVEQGVPCMQGICPEVYLEKAFSSSGRWSVVGGQWSVVSGQEAEGVRLPVAKELGETSLMFEVHPLLGKREMDETVRAVRDVMGKAGR